MKPYYCCGNNLFKKGNNGIGSYFENQNFSGKKFVLSLVIGIIYMSNICGSLKINKEKSNTKKLDIGKISSTSKSIEIDPFQEITNENYKVSEHITKYFRNINHLDEDGKVIKEGIKKSSQTEDKFDGSDNELENIQAEVQKSGVYTFEKLIDILKNKPQLILSKIKTPSPNDTFEFPRFNSIPIPDSNLTKTLDKERKFHYLDFDENDLLIGVDTSDTVINNGESEFVLTKEERIDEESDIIKNKNNEIEQDSSIVASSNNDGPISLE